MGTKGRFICAGTEPLSQKKNPGIGVDLVFSELIGPFLICCSRIALVHRGQK